jgi:hypothetical protein
MAHVTIDDTDPFISYTVGGSARTDFAVPFTYFQNSDLTVTVQGETFALDVDYSVTGDGDTDAGFESGTITLTDSVTNVTVTIERVLPVERTTDFPNSGPLSIRALNTQFDKLIAICQQLALGIARVAADLVDAINLFSTLSSAETTQTQFVSRGALVLANVAASVQFIRTAGYYDAGDGGDALYIRAAVQVIGAGKVQSADGAWWEYVGDEIDPRALGAYCDGAHATEDTAAADEIRQMVAAGTINTILLPSNSVTLINTATALAFAAGSVTIRGDRTAVIKAANSAALGSIITTFSACTESNLIGFTIDGNRANGGLATDLSAPVIITNDNSCLDDIEIKNAPLYGVLFSEPSAGTPVRHALVTRSHLHDIGTNVNIADNIGVGIQGHLEDCSITKNRFENIYALVAPLGDCAAVNIRGRGFDISDNTIKNVLNVNGGIIVVSDGLVGANDIDAVIRGNHIENTLRFSAIVPAATDDQTGGLEIQGAAVEAAHNIIKGVPAVGIGAGDGSGHDIDIHHNYIDGAAVGISCLGTPYNIDMQHNKIKNAATYGLAFSGGGINVVFANNRLETVAQAIAGTKVILKDNIGAQATFMQVADLPDAATYAGWQLSVADATVTTIRSIVVGGGANAVTVLSDSADWRIVG